MEVTPAQAAAWLDRFADRLENELREAEVNYLRVARSEAIRLSQGPHSSVQLAKWGHPYGHGNRPERFKVTPTYIINVQTGVFRADWISQGPVNIGGDYASVTKNTAWYAGFMWGTSRMIPRMILEAVASNTYLQRVSLHEAHATRAMR